MQIKKWIFIGCIMKMTTIFAVMDGQSLLGMCNDAIKVFNNGNYSTRSYEAGLLQLENSAYCNGYISAIADVAISGKLICVPMNSIYEQYVRIVTRYFNNNPNQLSYSAPYLISTALEQAFPCSASNQK